MKRFILLALFLALFSMLFLSGIESAAATTWNVNPGDKIQDAVDDAHDGDIIIVNDGGSPYTYQGEVKVNKNVTIKSNGNVTVKNSPPNAPYPSDYTAPVFTINNQGSGCIIQGFKVDAPTGLSAILLTSVNGCTLSELTIVNSSIGVYLSKDYTGPTGNSNILLENILIESPSSWGIWKYEISSVENLTLKNVTINNSSTYGIDLTQINDGFIKNLLLDNVTITGAGTNSLFGYDGLHLEMTDDPSGTITIKNSKFNNNTWIGVSITNGKGPIYIQNTTMSNNVKFGLLVTGTDNSKLTLLDSTVINNGPVGIDIANCSADIHYNNIYGSSTAYLFNDGSRFVNAENNWWGSNSNPSSHISGSNVDYDPWITKISEISLIKSEYTADIRSLKSVLNNGNVTGDLSGTFNLTDFNLVMINSGIFSGKGFFKAKWTSTLNTTNYNGDYKGVAYLDPNNNRIYLKGMVSGNGNTGICEGFLTETTSGSGLYDKYSSMWTFNRLSGILTSTYANLNLNGILSGFNTVNYPSTKINALTGNFNGKLSGDYTQDLDVLLSLVRINDAVNPFNGEGFSILSYNSNLGQGQGWTYCSQISTDRTEMEGLLSSPLLGYLSGELNENTPSSLMLTSQRIDIGLPPMADLEVVTYGLNVSPGETIDYIIEYRNQGLREAKNVVVMDRLPLEVEYISSTRNGKYDSSAKNVYWELGTVPPGTNGLLSVKVRVNWGLTNGSSLMNAVYIGTPDPEKDGYLYPASQIPFTQEWYDNSIRHQMYVYNGQVYEKPDKSFSVNYYDVRINNQTYVNIQEAVGRIQGIDPVVIQELQSLINQGRVRIDAELETKKWYGSWDSITEIMSITDKFNGFFIDTDLNTLNLEQKTMFLDDLATTLVHETQHRLYSKEHITSDDPVEVQIDETNACLRDIRYTLKRVNDEYNKGNYAEIDELLDNLFETADYLGKFDQNISDYYISQYGQLRQLYNNKPSDSKIKAIADYEIYFINKKLKIDNTSPNPPDPPDGVPEPPIPDLKPPGSNNSGSASGSIKAGKDPNILYGPEGPVSLGQILNYKVEFENTGEGKAYGVYITDVLSQFLDETTLQIGDIYSTLDNSTIIGHGTYNPATRTITWTISGDSEVASLAGGYAEFSIKVRNDTPNNTDIINYATVYFPSVPEETRTNGIVSYIDMTAPQVVVNIKGGYFNKTQNIKLTATDNKDTSPIIYYTTNGTTPTTSSTKYTTSISISTTKTLKFLAVDSAGNKSSVYSQTYTIDKIAPKVLSTSPTNLKTGVSRTGKINVKFNESIYSSTYYNKITIKNMTTGKTVTITKSMSGSYLYLNTTSKRSSNTWYQVTIPAGAVKDKASNKLTKAYTFKFKTGA
jgi:uncharacterized repeat protein (TIGR01451 family)